MFWCFWCTIKRQAVVARIVGARPERITEPAAIQHARAIEPLINAATVCKKQLSLNPGARRQKNCGDIGGHAVIRVATVNELKSSLKDQGIDKIQASEIRVGGDGL